MGNIALVPMTREMYHQFYRGFQDDPMLYMDMSRFSAYVDSPERTDRSYDRQMSLHRAILAVILDGRPIGVVKLKDIDMEKRECSLGIALQDDSVKGRGYGTEAERRAPDYAFEKMGMAAVNADAVLKNARSQHVLEKAGFRYVRADEMYKYYRAVRRDISPG